MKDRHVRHGASVTSRFCQARWCNIAIVALVTALAAAGCGARGGPSQAEPRMSEPRDVGGLKTFAYQDGARLVTVTASGELDFLPGVNLGATIPGTAPGEVAIGREEFRRWFPMMAGLGLRVLRIYTILPPHFYEELESYNSSYPDQPLFLVQGVWIPEAEFLETQDLFAPGVRDGFREEIARAVSVVHGDTSIAPVQGHASGTYTADVSPWLIAWIIGVELDPAATHASDIANNGHTPFRGDYFQVSPDASPTESWLAEMMDYVATEEATHGRSMPIAFTNWPTTDPLEHPDEPLDREDLVSIDANHVQPTEAWPGGTFASYHAYPYYPDFQRYEAGIADYEYRGGTDAYAGYVAKLAAHHASMPVVISEFGVPSSWAHAHFGPNDRDQGDHSEQEAMAIDAELMEIIHDQGLAGAFVFEWIDEWFKFTWNTIDFELPSDRRQLWHNPLTNEAHFGLLAADPASAEIVVDGDGSEWEEPGSSQTILESRQLVREVRATHDEAFLYLRVVLDLADVLDGDRVTIGFDIVQGGAGGLPGSPGDMPDADYAALLGPGAEGRVEVSGPLNPLYWQYGLARDFVEIDAAWLNNGSMHWSLYQLITNRPLRVPSTGEVMPVEVTDAGLLRQGTADPADPRYDSRTAWAATGRTIELRLPYQAIGVADPSSLTAYRPLEDGSIATEDFERIAISVAVGDVIQHTAGYGWEPWQQVEWRERPKTGLDRIAAATAAVEPSDSP